jgi:CoA:oxalate CoA-transferase
VGASRRSPGVAQLATDTRARRLRGLDHPVAPATALPPISWHGPALLPGDAGGSETCVQARCGLMEVNGRDAGVPRRLGLEVASVAAGILAAQAHMAADLAADRGLPRPDLRTSVLQAGLVLLSHYFVVATGLGDAVPGPPLAAPGPPFRSADGRWFEIETLDAEPWQEFWARLGAGDADLGRGWTVFRWRYERAACSLPPGLHEAVARYPLAELARVAAAAEVSLAPLRAYPDVVADPGPGAGRPLLYAGGGDPAPSPPGDGALPLTGIKVVEATSRIQGPFAGMLLRMLGADVVRIQPPEGDYGRAARCLHRGKDAVRLDLGTAAGRAALVELVMGADAFLHNWRPGKAAEWRLDFADLAPRHRRLVYANTSGWGDRPQAGYLVGTDFLVQAHVGLGHALHPEPAPPFPSRVVLSDLVGGLLGAEGVLAALCRRQRAGGAWEVRSSLLAGAMALQAHVLEDLIDGKEVGRRGGRPVWGPLDRPLETTDGLLAVTVEDDETFERLCRRCHVDPSAGARTTVERRVAEQLAAGTAAGWEDRLNGSGIAAAAVCTDLAEVAADPRLSHLFEPVGIGGVAPKAPWTFA